MFKLSLKNIWSRKGRLLLTAAAVIAGTAFLSGVFVFTDTIKGTFDRIFASAYANTDAYVRSSNVIEGDFGDDTRDRIDDTLVGIVQAVPGVTEAVGTVQGSATITTSDGKVVGQDGPPKFGGSWSDSESSPWTLAEGRAPSGAGEVVIDKRSATDGKIKVGDTVTITTTGEPRQFTVVGVGRFAGQDTTGGATWALFDLPTAQEFVVGDPGKLDAVVVRGDGSLTQQELADRVEQAIAEPEVEVLTGKQITDENQSQVEKSLSFLTIFLTIFALISLFVGSFIIYNVFSISAAQRQRENALLRAIGASRSQVTRSQFVEAFVVGVGGSLIGCVGGIGLASLILSILSSAGFGPASTELVLHPAGFIITMIVGTLVTIACAIAPALRAGRVPPLAAMRDVSVDRADASRRRLVIGVVLLAGAIGAISAGIVGNTTWLGLGVVLLFISLISLGPLVAGPVAKLLTPALAATSGTVGTIAGRNASRSPKRTALTAGALGVGLALLIGVATLGSSSKASIKAVFGKSFQGDYTVSPEQGNGGIGIPSTIADEINASGKANAVGLVVTKVGLKGGDDTDFRDRGIVAVDPAAAQKIVTLDFVSGGFDQLDANGILVSKDKADRDDTVVGDPIEVRFLNGTTKTLRVEGIFDSEVFGNQMVDRAVFDGTGQPLFDAFVFADRVEGVSAGESESAIKSIVDKYPTAKFQTRDEYIDDQSSQIDTFLNFIYALLLMSVFIAVLGIVITLILAVYERRRELGLSRAVGMTRMQVSTSVLWESVVTAIIGIIMGVGLGVSLGWIVVKALADQGLDVFELPITTIVVFVILSLVFAMVASLYPAWRASRADILTAIATT